MKISSNYYERQTFVLEVKSFYKMLNAYTTDQGASDFREIMNTRICMPILIKIRCVSDWRPGLIAVSSKWVMPVNNISIIPCILPINVAGIKVNLSININTNARAYIQCTHHIWRPQEENRSWAATSRFFSESNTHDSNVYLSCMGSFTGIINCSMIRNPKKYCLRFYEAVARSYQ